jgi:AraC-like DNA-binding protein
VPPETTAQPVEDISWAAGYEDLAAIRRLFKRLTGLTPGEYRRRFHLPLPIRRPSAMTDQHVALWRGPCMPRPCAL